MDAPNQPRSTEGDASPDRGNPDGAAPAPPAALAARYRDVMDRVAAAARAAGRRETDVVVIAVSKYTELDDIRRLADLGHRDFGESQVQQLVQRADMLEHQLTRRREFPELDPAIGPGGLYRDAADDDKRPDRPGRWHMIGHLQRNKVKKCLGAARLIHSVDSLRLVDEIHSVAFKRDVEVELLVQVNVTGEQQKYGCAPAAARHLCEQIDSLVHLKVRGIMAMGPASQDDRDTRLAFDRARELYEEIVKLKLCEGRFNILSMGMSGDFETAIAHGANMVRVGSAIFGSRDDHAPDDDEHDDATSAD